MRRPGRPVELRPCLSSSSSFAVTYSQSSTMLAFPPRASVAAPSRWPDLAPRACPRGLRPPWSCRCPLTRLLWLSRHWAATPVVVHRRRHQRAQGHGRRCAAAALRAQLLAAQPDLLRRRGGSRGIVPRYGRRHGHRCGCRAFAEDGGGGRGILPRYGWRHGRRGRWQRGRWRAARRHDLGSSVLGARGHSRLQRTACGAAVNFASATRCRPT